MTTDVSSSLRARNITVTTFVHEPWVPPTRLPWIPLSWIHRRQLRRLIRMSDQVVTTVPRWRDGLGRHVHIVYIGCTLGELDGPIGAGEPLRAPVVFSPFAGGLRWDWIVAAAAAIGADPQLIVIGADAATVRDHTVVGRWFRPDWDYRGHLPAPELLDLLSRARLVLAPYVDGLTGRRTSAFAATATGARLLTSTGHLFDPFFLESPLYVASTLDDFVQRARSVWREPDADSERSERLAWHLNHMDAAALDKRLLDIVVQ